MSYYEHGSLVSNNVPEDICGGERPISECSTVRELAKRVVSVDIKRETGIVDSWASNGDANMACADCKKQAGVAVHVVDKRPTEELCFVFSDQDKPVLPDASVIVETEE